MGNSVLKLYSVFAKNLSGLDGLKASIASRPPTQPHAGHTMSPHALLCHLPLVAPTRKSDPAYYPTSRINCLQDITEYISISDLQDLISSESFEVNLRERSSSPRLAGPPDPK